MMGVTGVTWMTEKEEEEEMKEKGEEGKFLRTGGPTKGSTRGPRGPKKGICSALPICKILWAEPVVSIAYGQFFVLL